LGRGTRNFRALELLSGKVYDSKACDIYSLGVLLFFMKTSGMIPFKEQSFENFCGESSTKSLLVPENHFGKYFQENKEKFWKIHSKLTGEKINFTEDFRKLFESLCDPNPNRRPTINEVKKFVWYK